MSLEYSRYNYLYWDVEINRYLLFNFLTGSLISLDEDNKQLFEAITKREGFHQEKQLLRENGFLVDNFDEIAYLKYGNKLTTADTDMLSVLIAPTLACNFDCPYCFEHHGNGLMADNIQHQIVAFIEKAIQVNHPKHLFVYWFGGEPLLGIHIIQSMAKEILELVSRYGLVYTSSMSTNGYLLTPENVAILEESGLTDIQVTIDGIGKTHDATRRLKNGSGSFDVIITNLKRIRSRIKFLIRCNLNKGNQNELPLLRSLIDQIQEETGTEMHFYSAHMSVYEYNNENVDQLELEASDYSALLKTHDMLSSTKKHFAKFVFCEAARKNSFCFDEKGLLYKCWNDIGNAAHSYGSVSDYLNGCLNYKTNHALEYLGDSFPDDDDECLNCKLLPLCMGGCITKRIFEKKKACIPIKYNIEDYIHKKYMIEKGVDYCEAGN